MRMNTRCGYRLSLEVRSKAKGTYYGFVQIHIVAAVRPFDRLMSMPKTQVPCSREPRATLTWPGFTTLRR